MFSILNCALLTRKTLLGMPAVVVFANTFDDELSFCTDIDECSLMVDNCDNNAFCTDTEGGFTCECTTGFTGDGVNCQSELKDCKNLVRGKIAAVSSFVNSALDTSKIHK